MITVVTGENSYMLLQYVQDVIARFVEQYSDMGLERLDGEDVSFDRIRESLQSLPFLASKKLVVLRNPSTHKQFIEQASSLLAELPETTDVVIIESKLDKRSGYYKLLKSKTDYQQFDALDESAIVRYLVTQAKEHGAQLTTADARYLVQRSGNASQAALTNELIKLMHYNPHISRTTIDLLVEPALQSSIFELLDAALAGNSKRAMELYDLQRAARVEPQQIIAMVAWQLHILALVKTAGAQSPDMIAKAAKLSPYVVRKSASAVRNLTTTNLRLLIRSALDLDVRMKSSAIPADDALRLYLLELASR